MRTALVISAVILANAIQPGSTEEAKGSLFIFSSCMGMLDMIELWVKVNRVK